MKKDKIIKKANLWFAAIIFIFQGSYALFAPDAVVALLSVVVGVIFLVFGILNAYNGFTKRDEIIFPYSRILWGILLGIVGVIFMFNRSLPNFIIAVAFGILGLIIAVFKLAGAFNLKKMGENWILMLVGSIINFVFSLLIIFFPIISGNIFIQLLGIYWIYLGVSFFISSFSGQYDILFL